MKNELLQDVVSYDYSDVEISFSITTKLFDLQTLTEFLNLNPTRGWTNGEKYKGRQLNTDTKEIEIIERQKLWTLFVYETKELVNSDRFQDHAEYLIDKLDPIKANIKDLLAQSDKFKILIHVHLQFDKKQDYFGFSTQAETLKKLTDYCHEIEWRNK